MFGKTLGPQFSWLEHAKLSHPIRTSDRKEMRFLNASVQSAARHADWCFRHDKSGCAGYSWLARFFQRAGNPLMATFYHDIAGMRMRLTRDLATITINQLTDEATTNEPTPEDIIAHAAAQWELVTMTDPETPTGTGFTSEQLETITREADAAIEAATRWHEPRCGIECNCWDGRCHTDRS